MVADSDTVTIQGDGDHPYISYDLRLIDLELRVQHKLNEQLFPGPKTADDLLNKVFLEYMAGYISYNEWEKIRPLVPKAMEKYTKKVTRRR